MSDSTTTDTIISDADELRARYGEPSDLARDKVLTSLDQHCRAFISASPFLVIGTAAADGSADVSPRGDGPGFVAILDDNTVLIPDRPGNRRVDTMSNILQNPNVALIFFVPGMNETLRLNGSAQITKDSELLAPLAVRTRVPQAGILVHIQEVFLHCAKALIRSHLWDPKTQIERQTFPPLGKMIADQIAGLDADEAENAVQDSIANRLY